MRRKVTSAEYYIPRFSEEDRVTCLLPPAFVSYQQMEYSNKRDMVEFIQNDGGHGVILAAAFNKISPVTMITVKHSHINSSSCFIFE